MKLLALAVPPTQGSILLEAISSRLLLPLGFSPTELCEKKNPKGQYKIFIPKAIFIIHAYPKLEPLTSKHSSSTLDRQGLWDICILCFSLSLTSSSRSLTC